ncbi:hypothetical protein JCM8202_004256 [Rhodotorula sphaerocarpa]
MTSPALAASLAQLTGLDVATAQEQLLPHLDSLKSSNEVRNYLGSLLAPGPAAQTFTSLYTNHRFPPASAPAPSPSAAGGAASWANRNPSPSPSSASGRGPSRSSSPANGPLHASREKDLDRAQRTAPKGGKVYIKEREDQLDQQWGGAALKSPPATSTGTRSNRSQPLAPIKPPPEPVRAPSQASRADRSAAASSALKKDKGKAPQTKPAEAGTELSEEGALELLRIEKALRGFEAKAAGQRRVCFCMARQHPLATYAPLCPRCSLILCTINRPSAPCPSCSHTPLLSPTATATHIATLQTAREDLLAREKRRVQLAREQEERERAAIRFPDLGAADVRVPVPGGGRTYAGHAGGGAGLSDRIERAYEARAAQLAAAKASAGGAAAGTASSAGRVLRLDGKTGRVKVQTKVAKPSSGSAGKGKVTMTEETTAVLDADDADDGYVPWIDEDDDGVRGEPALQSRTGEAIAQCERERPAGRPFANVTLAEEEWYTYISIDEQTTRLDDDEGDGDGGGDGGARAGNGLDAGPGATISGPVAAPTAPRERATVPGAAIPKPVGDGAKSKRRRGKGAKDVVGGEASARDCAQ